MVTTRGADSIVNLQKAKSKEYFEKIGQSGYTRTRKSRTTNAAGRTTAISSATLSLIGDMQFVSVNEKKYIDLGIASLGDGMFFTLSSYDLAGNDEITTPSGYIYRLTKQIEGEQTAGEEIYQGWIALRLPDAD